MDVSRVAARSCVSVLWRVVLGCCASVVECGSNTERRRPHIHEVLGDVLPFIHSFGNIAKRVLSWRAEEQWSMLLMAGRARLHNIGSALAQHTVAHDVLHGHAAAVAAHH